jgi:hypothetical protein
MLPVPIMDPTRPRVLMVTEHVFEVEMISSKVDFETVERGSDLAGGREQEDFATESGGDF